MTAEAPNPLVQARIYCIKEAAQNNFDMADPSIPDWMKVGVAEYRAGRKITPEVLHRIDQRGADFPRS
jgi:hypothetical protein